MRLKNEEIQLLKSNLHTLSKSARLFLFGSRIDDTKRGGDIDLLILDEKLTKRDIRKLRIEFFKKYGEQKMDIIIDKPDFQNPFTKYIFKSAIEL